MNISRFFGSTNREALRQVRLALGPDALIVSNRRVNGGVEILATDPTSMPPDGAQASAPAGAPAASTPPSYATQPPAQDPRAEVMSAIGEMRGALENRIDELLWSNQLRRAPQAVSLFQTMLGFGFSTALLRAMLKRLPEQLSAKAAFQWARHELVTHLPVLDNEDALWTQGLALALVGPTGVGKTTTIAKLAARCVRRGGPDSLVLLTTDTYRIGAHEQLNIYGQMLRVPVHVVQDINELRQVMQRIRPDQTILIDNVGISQRDRYIAEQAAMLAGAGRPIQRLLVLNASSHGDTLDEVARTYANDGGSALKGCIITKVDEASRLGASLDTAIRYQLPIHYVSNGQKVPQDLAFLQAAELVDQALVHSQQARVLYAPTEADLAALMSLSKAPQADDGAAAERRRQRLLPGLLSMAGTVAPQLSTDDLDAACVYIDEQDCMSEAYDLWRAHTSGSAAANLDADIRHLGRVAQNACSVQGGRVLALHDHVAAATRGGRRGQLRAALLLGERGQAYSTVMQQVSLAEGWQSSCGASAQTAPSAADALRHQVQWLSTHHAALPLVHLFEGGTQALWRAIHDENVDWLVQCAPTTRIHTDLCPTTVGAVAKTLHHTSITQADCQPVLAEAIGVPMNDLVLWTAEQEVQLVTRAQPTLSIRLVSLRVVNRRDGATIKTFHGLTNMTGATTGVDRLASWLLIRAEARLAMRLAARVWDALPAREEVEPVLRKALTAVQAGLAAWQLKYDDAAASSRAVAASLVGKQALPALTAAPALLKLFALKELMA